MPGGSIFISYRREDAAGEAGRLSDHLGRRFGPQAVFMDIDTIVPGTDFVVELDRALGGTAVVLVVIGRKWLQVTNPDGSRRIDDRQDFVRREIQTALERGTRVIPVLVQGATMPGAADLPDELAPLATRQASAIQHEEFSADAQRLADAIAPHIETTVPALKRWRGRAALGGAAAVVLLGLVAWLGSGAGAPEPPTAEALAREARQRQVDDLVSVAAGQQQRRQYADALATLDKAVVIDADLSRAKTLQEDVAMASLRESNKGDHPTFAEAIKTSLAVVDRAAPFATGTRKADLDAHLGWAAFLRMRDGDRRSDPEPLYRQSIAADPANPFANVMLGHWVLWTQCDKDGLDRARPLFRAAADAGRALDYVRGAQLAALRNHASVACTLEAIRVLDEMRSRGEPVPQRHASSLWSEYYFALGNSGDLQPSTIAGVLPPADHLLTLQWAFDAITQGDDSRRRQYRFYTAMLQAAAGRTTEAREALRALKAELGPDSSGSLPSAVDKALKELGSAPR